MDKPAPDCYYDYEGNGQTSAWLVCSALGYNQVYSAKPQSVPGFPLIKTARIIFGNLRSFTAAGPATSSVNRYDAALGVNVAAHANNCIDHFTLLSGGSINFKLTTAPKYLRGAAGSNFSYPYSVHK